MWIFRRKREHIGLETLSEYLDGRLPPGESGILERHLEACSMCSEELNSLDYAVGLLQRLPMVTPHSTFTLGEAPSTTWAVPRVRAPAWAYGAAASVAVFLFALVLSGDLSGFLAEDISAPAAVRLAETETENDTTTPAETESVKAAPPATFTEPSADGAELAVPDTDQQMAAAAMEAEAAPPPPVAPPDPSSALVEPEEPVAVADSPLQPSEPSEPERAAASAPPTEPDETLTGPPAEAADGGTAPVWRILEGVFGGVALLLVGLVLWRMRRHRRRITS